MEGTPNLITEFSLRRKEGRNDDGLRLEPVRSRRRVLLINIAQKGRAGCRARCSLGRLELGTAPKRREREREPVRSAMTHQMATAMQLAIRC